jgi:hypothetical protein
MRHLESKLQQQCVKWIRLQYPNIICVAIPNGGKRSKAMGGIMVAEGLYKGAADLFIPLSNRHHYGLFIEMKVGKGKQTEAQMKFEKNVTANGYKYVVCRSLFEFMDMITYYLNNEL